MTILQEEARAKSGREHAALLRQQVQQHDEQRRAQASVKAAEGAAHRHKLEQDHAVIEVRSVSLTAAGICGVQTHARKLRPTVSVAKGGPSKPREYAIAHRGDGVRADDADLIISASKGRCTSVICANCRCLRGACPPHTSMQDAPDKKLPCLNVCRSSQGF